MKTISSAILAGAMVMTAGASAQEVQAVVGQPAPAFTLPDPSGAMHSLSDFAGKVVVLEWTNPGCPFVVRHYEADTMQTLDAAFPDDQVVFLSIDSTHDNTAEAAAAWQAREGFTHTLLLDVPGDVGRLYGARTTPHMFVIAPDGTLAYAGAMDDDPRGSNPTPSNYVNAAVSAVLAGTTPDPSSTQPYGCTVKYE